MHSGQTNLSYTELSLYMRQVVQTDLSARQSEQNSRQPTDSRAPTRVPPQSWHVRAPVSISANPSTLCIDCIVVLILSML
jgi:hypothetical protein